MSLDETTTVEGAFHRAGKVDAQVVLSTLAPALAKKTARYMNIEGDSNCKRLACTFVHLHISHRWLRRSLSTDAAAGAEADRRMERLVMRFRSASSRPRFPRAPTGSIRRLRCR
jgi:hypothetical protein